MSVSIFPPPTSGGGGGGDLTQIAYTLSGRIAVIDQVFSAGVYSFTGPSSRYTATFYDSLGDIITIARFTSAVTSFAITLSAQATRLIVMADTSGAGTITYTPNAVVMSTQLITTTQSVTITNRARVFVLGGGASGSASNGGGSGYFAKGFVDPGTYTATVGAGGAGGAGQAGGTSSLDTVVATGGNGANGGSGGGLGQSTSVGGGLSGGYNGANGGGLPTSGSGVPLDGFNAGPAGAGSGGAGTAQGGGLYGGGGGGGTNIAQPRTAASDYAGGGGGSAGGGLNGYQGIILIVEGF